jgi:hypothetical protein
MAQHIEIEKSPIEILFGLTEPEQFRNNPHFKRVPFKINGKKRGEIYLNSRDYNEGSGLRGDEYVLTLNLKGAECSYEVHFNYRNKINKVYQVQ